MPNDVFISYCHKDNLRVALPSSSSGDSDRWVGVFESRLREYLAQLLQREVRVWRDLKLRNNDELSDEIRRELRDSAVLVPLVSPSFASSNWCPDEVQLFLDILSDRGAADRAASWIHPAVKLPVSSLEDLPPVVSGKLGIHFYQKDDESDHILQWDPTNPSDSTKFLEAIYALSDDIRAVIQQSQVPPTGPRIFLGRSDRTAQLPRVRKELIKLGYRLSEDEGAVFPDNEPAFRQVHATLLGQCELVVLLPGRQLLGTPGGLQVERLQWEIIRERLGDTMKCLAWVDDKRSPASDEQEEWIEQIGKTAGVELIRCPFQQFLADLEGMLKRLKPPVPPDSPRWPTLAVDCHDSDVGHPLLNAGLAALRSASQCRVEEVLQPGIDSGSLRERRRNFAGCADAMLLFSARGSAAWLQARYDETLKIRPDFAAGLQFALAPEGAEDKRMIFRPEPANFIMADDLNALRNLAIRLMGGGAS